MKMPLVLMLLVLGTYISTPTNAMETKKPNVIVILTDDQGYGDMSIHGNKDIFTPNLDKLARDSVSLSNLHVSPTCSPSRAALMTGRYDTRAGVWLTYAGRNHLRKNEITMADVFKHNGYRTGIFGKWHLGDNYPFRPTDRGFDHAFIHGGGVAGEIPDYWGNNYFDDTYFSDQRPTKVKGYSTDIWFDQANAFIDKNTKNPFFIYLATNTPHGPYNVLKQYVEPYLAKGIEPTRARFYAMIDIIDKNVGGLRAQLEKSGISENTILVFMTDNGTTAGYVGSKYGWPKKGFNAGMRGKKGSAYEGGHRAAGFIHWPKGQLKHGTKVNQLAAHFDILPTLIDMAQLSLPKAVEFDGTSLLPLLNGQKKSLDERTLFVHHQGRFGKKVGEGKLIKDKDYAVMTQNWRLVGKELFNIVDDPAQRHDVAKSNPEVVKTLTKAYKNWFADVSAGSDAYVPTIIDTTKQSSYLLTSQAWHGDKIPYSQHHVKHAMAATGFWPIDVSTAGEYLIEMRRWPKELDLEINKNITKQALHPGIDTSHRFNKLPNQAISAITASLQLDDTLKTKAVSKSDKGIVFKKKLTPGLHKISAWFDGNEQQKWGAYYLYITPVN